MANVFLDANCLIDLLENRDTTLAQKLEHHQLFLSALSIHILCYVGKYVMPSKLLEQALAYFTVISVNQEMLTKSFKGPTPDFEDNLHLHSAMLANCDYFLTNDKALLQNSKWQLVPAITPAQLQDN